jgi:hypothetical protein
MRAPAPPQKRPVELGVAVSDAPVWDVEGGGAACPKACELCARRPPCAALY